MATIYFPTNQAFGPIAFDADGTAPTAMYIYPDFPRFTAAEGREYGYQSAAGTLTDGKAIDYLQAMTTDGDTSTAALELDDDDDSPYKGFLRVKITMA